MINFPIFALARHLTRFAPLLLALMVTACATRPYNAPLDHADPATAYTFFNRLPRNSPKLFVVLSFSGGGMRAAAFTQGVLEKLASTRIWVDGESHRLLDEVDVITAVSGGSFTAAYYGLFGERGLADFAQEFLYRDIQGEMIAEIVSPAQLAKIAAPHFSRTDAVADYLDRTLFKGKTFADLSGDGRAPYIILNAADLNTGTTFSFTQMQFDYLCSDLTPFPVARAVMASAAVPIVFAPLVLRNQAGDCPQRHPDWVAQALAERNPADRRFHAATALASYASPQAVPYVQLVDGGIVDNLGVRGSIMSEVSHHGRVIEMAGAFSAQAMAQVEHVLVIASNTQAISGREWLRAEEGPGLLETAEALADATNNLLNAETTLLAQKNFDMWANFINLGRCADCPKVTIDFSVLSFDRLVDVAERTRFSTTPSTFHLDRETVDALRTLPSSMLDDAPEFQTFLERMKPSHQNNWSR
ncbi:MAG: patatin [Comamonadaceae bacterium CG_4_9_14_3_um_filter_60_33]|nr:MAG: patatin [Comamonadaceae bacterium CG_4_10_14_3_um_filter_60_42]PJB45389.1 MAG: patatin [Comamonadaceae bacterium CG_4_9_14_3_um_filter_60_33]